MRELTFDDVWANMYHNDFIWAMDIAAKYPPFLALLSTWNSKYEYNMHPLDSHTHPYYLVKCDHDTKQVNWNHVVKAEDHVFANSEEEINAMYNMRIQDRIENLQKQITTLKASLLPEN